MKKNEKLEGLLNKIVEYNNPDVSYYKGFLYRDDKGYYIKVVEGILGDFAIHSKIRISTADVNLISKAEKPKLMRVSLKSWHYKLIKFVLGKNAPTPKTMQNGCPYFWILIFCLFVSPFVGLFTLFMKSLVFFIDAYEYLLIKMVDACIPKLSDEEIYEYYYDGDSNYNSLPLAAKFYYGRYGSRYFLKDVIYKKYNINKDVDKEKYLDKCKEIESKWSVWRNEMRDKRNERARLIDQKEYEKRVKKIEKERISKEKWEKRTKPIVDKLDKIYDAITIDFSNYKDIIRFTKRIVGGIITLSLLISSFYVVNIISFVLMMLFGFIAEYWIIILISLGIITAFILFTLLVHYFVMYIKHIIKKYNAGKKVWYVEGLKFSLLIPIKYIGLYIWYSLLYVILIPIKFVFYDVIFKLILVNIGKFIWNVLTKLFNSILGSTGIFGEYFSASYSDYCPALEWTDVEDNDDDDDE